MLGKVGDYAFYHCVNLTKFGTSQGDSYMGVYQVGDYSFAYCSKLGAHNVNNNLTFSGGKYRTSTSTKYSYKMYAPQAKYRVTPNFSQTTTIGTKIDVFDTTYSTNNRSTYSSESSSRDARGFGLFYGTSFSYSSNKRGSQVGVGAFLNCTSLKFNSPIYNLYCVNPYSFAYCKSLATRSSGTTNDGTIDYLFPGIFNLSSSSRDTKRGTDYSTIATNAFYGANAYVGTYFSTTYLGVQLYIYTADIEPYGLNGLSMRSQSGYHYWSPFLGSGYSYSYNQRGDSSTVKVRIGVSRVTPLFLAGLGGGQYTVSNANFDKVEMTNVDTFAFSKCSQLVGFYLGQSYWDLSKSSQCNNSCTIYTHAFWNSGLRQIILPHGGNNNWYNGMVDGSSVYAILTTTEDYGKKSDREFASSYAAAGNCRNYSGNDGQKYSFGWYAASLENRNTGMYAKKTNGDWENDNASLIYLNKQGYECGGKDFNSRKGNSSNSSTSAVYTISSSVLEP